MTEVLSQYGLAGAVIIALAGYVLMIEKRHREERDEWRKSIDRQNDESNRITRENTNILSALKSMLENRR